MGLVAASRTGLLQLLCCLDIPSVSLLLLLLCCLDIPLVSLQLLCCGLDTLLLRGLRGQAGTGFESLAWAWN